MLLGRFLEVSVQATDVVASLAFYESLGFVQAATGDVWNHPYGVVTDGRLSIGLHQQRALEPTLTWVVPGLAGHAPRLAALGIEFESTRLDAESFHAVDFRDPAGQMIALLEARTFSPPQTAPAQVTQLGYFEEYGIPTAELEASAAFWDALGLVAFEPVRRPFHKVAVTGRDLNIGLYDLDLPAPVLAFSDPDMARRIALLRERGLPFVDRLPRGLSPKKNALLQAPEGTWLLLTAHSA